MVVSLTDMQISRLLHLLPLLCFAGLLGSGISSCKPDDCPECPEDSQQQDSNRAYDFQLKPHFANIGERFDNTPVDNPTTVKGVELGRYLFYDERLSINNTIACASCHEQKKAFTDPDRFSEGFEGELTRRNSMSIVNMRWQPGFFWDLRAATLEEQVLMPIQDHIEMGMTLEQLTPKLTEIELYPPLFKASFGDEEITADRISKALAQFVRTIVSQDSRFDETYSKNPQTVLTDQEYLGYKLFFKHVDPDFGTGQNLPGSDTRGANCGDCHSSTLLTLNTIANNGLDTMYQDKGYGEIVNKDKYMGTFKTPTLRNIELTAPYMHDGRFETLREVLDHYDSHVKDHRNLDPQISEAGNYFPGQLDLTDPEKDAILAFLKTLTDEKLISNPAYSNPFE